MRAANFIRIIAISLLVVGLGTVPAAAGKPDKKPPTAPTNLHITATGPNSISLAWNPSTDNSNSWWYLVSGCGGAVTHPTTTFTNPNLEPDKLYTCSVYATDAAGNRSASSNSVSYKTPPDTTPPSAPTLSAPTVYPARIFLSWTASTDNAPGEVAYSMVIDGVLHIGGPGYLTWPILNLAPRTTHQFQVIARDSSGNTTPSNLLTVTTPAATESVPPSAPTNLALGFQSTSLEEAWLSWGASTDNADSQGQILYNVYFNDVLMVGDSAIGGTSTIAYCRDVDGPTAITVVAVDTSGNQSAPSNAVDFDC